MLVTGITVRTPTRSNVKRSIDAPSVMRQGTTNKLALERIYLEMNVWKIRDYQCMTCGERSENLQLEQQGVPHTASLSCSQGHPMERIVAVPQDEERRFSISKQNEQGQWIGQHEAGADHPYRRGIRIRENEYDDAYISEAKRQYDRNRR